MKRSDGRNAKIEFSRTLLLSLERKYFAREDLNTDLPGGPTSCSAHPVAPRSVVDDEQRGSRTARGPIATRKFGLPRSIRTWRLPEGGNLSKVDGQYVYQERSLEEHQKHVRRLKALLSAISGSARIVPGRDVIALENQASGRSFIRPSAGTAPKQSSLPVALVAYFGLTTTD